MLHQVDETLINTAICSKYLFIYVYVKRTKDSRTLIQSKSVYIIL